jgi:hypothetical protein
MTAALDSHHAIEYLRLLSCDIASAAVFGKDGKLLAGEPVDGARGTVVSATAAGLTITATVGPNGMRGLLEHDLASAAAAMV